PFGFAPPVFQSTRARRSSAVQKPKSGATHTDVLSKSKTFDQCSIDQCSGAVLRMSVMSGKRKKFRRHAATFRLSACHASGASSTRYSCSKSAVVFGLSRYRPAFEERQS